MINEKWITLYRIIVMQDNLKGHLLANSIQDNVKVHIWADNMSFMMQHTVTLLQEISNTLPPIV